MRHERTFVVDEEASCVIEPYPALVRSLIHLSVAAFGIAFWGSLAFLLFR